VRRVTTFPVILVLLAVVAACGGSAATPSPSSEDPAPLETPHPVDPTAEDTAEPTPEESFPTEPPLVTSEPEESFPTEPPLITPPPGTSIPATSCSDNVDEQGFYAAVAGRVDWSVYCPGLPTGWRIGSGHYDVGRQGFLNISYTNRSGARLELSEGHFCDEADGCVPDGEDAGAAAFGDQTGTLVAGSDGSFAIVVDQSAPVSWLLIGRSIDEATFRDLAANLSRVEP
jgi:hypothetical protein